MIKAGWNYYSVIDLRYKNQVVAKKKDVADIQADSLRTLQLMLVIAANAEKQAGDTLQHMQQGNDRTDSDSLMIQQSIQRDENTDNHTSIINEKQPDKQPVLKASNVAVKKKTGIKKPMPLQKPDSAHKANPIQKPKVTMPVKNDY